MTPAKAGKALAVADGEGRNGVWLAEQGLDVLSVDFSPAAQAKAKALAARRGVAVRFVQADVTAWDWPLLRVRSWRSRCWSHGRASRPQFL